MSERNKGGRPLGAIACCPYLGSSWVLLAAERNMTATDVLHRWRALYIQHRQEGYSYRKIRLNRLDNPFMDDVAREAIKFDIHLVCSARNGLREPRRRRQAMPEWGRRKIKVSA